MSTHNLCFEQKYEKYQIFLSENFIFLEVKFSIFLNRRVFVMGIYDPACFMYMNYNSIKQLDVLLKSTTVRGIASSRYQLSM